MEDEDEDEDGFGLFRSPLQKLSLSLVAPGPGPGLPWAKWLVPQRDGIALIRHSRGEGAILGGQLSSYHSKQAARLVCRVNPPVWSCRVASLPVQGDERARP
jgi:hypothetical protein